MYADDCKISLLIDSPFDCFKLQADLDRLVNWGVENHIPVKISKCKVIKFCKSRSNYRFDYNINGEILEVVSSFNDLGIIFTSDFDFSKHIEVIVSKANRTLGWIKRNNEIVF